MAASSLARLEDEPISSLCPSPSDGNDDGSPRPSARSGRSPSSCSRPVRGREDRPRSSLPSRRAWSSPPRNSCRGLSRSPWDLPARQEDGPCACALLQIGGLKGLLPLLLVPLSRSHRPRL